MKKIIAFSLLSVLALTVLLSAAASTGLITKTLLYDDIKITLDSREIEPCDVNGNYIEPFIIEGTTYLPVRGIASSLGLDVGWNGETRTVSLDEPKNSAKAVVYNKNGVRIEYNGYEVTESGTQIKLFVQNDSDRDILFTFYEPSQSKLKKDKQHERTLPIGKMMNTAVVFESTEDVQEVTFSYALHNAQSLKVICNKTEVCVTPDGIKGEDNSYTDAEGEVTLQHYEGFFKHKGEFITDSGKYDITKYINDGEKRGYVSLSYSPNMKKFAVEAVLLSVVEDPVEEIARTVPISIAFEHSEQETYAPEKDEDAGKMKFNIDCLLGNRAFTARGNIDTSDGSLEIQTVHVEDYIYTDNLKYMDVNVQPVLEDMALSFATELMELIKVYGNGIFSENGSKLTLEYFGVK